MLTGFKHLHSANRYVLLALLIIIIITSFKKWKGNAAYTKQDDKLNLVTFILTHIQLLIGLVLYFTSGRVVLKGLDMSDKYDRFFTIEHLVGMLIAIALITIARIKGKKIVDAAKRHKLTFTYYLIALILIFASIPWPFRNVGITNWI